MKPESSLSCSQDPSSGLYPVIQSYPISLGSILILSSQLRLGLRGCLYPLSEKPNRVGVSPPTPEDGNRSSFRNAVFYFFEYLTVNKVRKPSNSECYTPPSVQFRIYRMTLFQWLLYRTWKNISMKAMAQRRAILPMMMIVSYSHSLILFISPHMEPEYALLSSK
jgi:hypothetical protein